MSIYSLALFLHVIGALTLFIALGLEWLSLLNLRRASTAQQAREWGSIGFLLPRLYIPAGLTILVSGFYMAAVSWQGAA